MGTVPIATKSNNAKIVPMVINDARILFSSKEISWSYINPFLLTHLYYHSLLVTVKIKSLHIKNKMEIFGIAVITSLFAGALISNLGSSSITVFAQDSQNATTQQQQGIALGGVLNFTQNLRMLEQELGLNTTSTPGEKRDRVQQFTNNSNFEQFSQRLSQAAQQSGLNPTRLEPASPNGDIMSRLQNFTEFVQAQRAGSNMTSSQ